MTTLAAVQTITQDVPWGQIAPWAFGAVAIIAVTILALAGKLPGFKGKVGDKEFQVGDPDLDDAPAADRRVTCARHAEIDESVDILIEQRRQTERKIMSSQVRSIIDSADAFDDLTAGLPPLLAEALWNRFDRALLVAAMENHILGHVDVDADGMRLHADYLEDKTLIMAQSYRRLTSKTSGLPAWADIETRAVLLMRVALDRFAEIARDEWEAFRGSVEAVSKVIGPEHPAVAARIKRLLEEE